MPIYWEIKAAKDAAKRLKRRKAKTMKEWNKPFSKGSDEHRQVIANCSHTVTVKDVDVLWYCYKCGGYLIRNTSPGYPARSEAREALLKEGAR